MRNSFTKKERIYKKEEIDLFFKNGKHFIIHPYRIIHYQSEVTDQPSEGLKLMISIPKKKIKRAVKRNLLKRRTKEAYRINKNDLKSKLSESKKSVSALLIYTSSECLDYTIIQDKIILILQRLQAIYAENSK